MNQRLARLLIILCFAGRGLAQSDATGDPGVNDAHIVIGSCAALDGASRMGVQLILGGSSYVNWVNEQGGVNGRKIQLLAFDDGYEPAKAESCFRRLLKEGVFATGLFVGTPTALKYVHLAAENKVPVVGLFTGAQFLYDPVNHYVFTIRASYRDEIREEINYAWNTLNLHQIGAIYQDDALGEEAAEGLRLALQEYHAVPAAVGTFPRNSMDVAKGMAALRASRPQAVLIAAPYAQAAQIVKLAHLEGWRPVFLTLSSAGTEKFIAAAGKDAEGTVITEVLPSYNHTDLETVALYREALKKSHPDAEPSALSLEGFVDAMVLVEGLKRSGKQPTREKFISAMESIRNQSLGLGPALQLNYNASRHKGLDTVFVTVVKGGKPAPVDVHKTITAAVP
jgi:ABC-type branched-subunit amino acid transport system substrate-binding protein